MTLRENMEKGLLEKKGEVKDGGSGIIRWSVFGEEVKRVGYLAGPMIGVNLSQYFLQIISMMMVGRLGKLALSSTAIAISLCNVSGLSVIVSLVFSSNTFFWTFKWMHVRVVYGCCEPCLRLEHQLHFLFCTCQTVWNVMRIGNSMWASIWSTAIQNIWCSDLHCNCLSCFSLSSSDFFVDELGEPAHFTWPRSFGFFRSWEICFVHDPCSLCLCNTSVFGSILFDAEFDESSCHKFLHYSLLPCGIQLVYGL